MKSTHLMLSMSLLLPLACIAADNPTTPPVASSPKPLDLKPGLWEITITSQVGDPAGKFSRQNLARMTPAEAAQAQREAQMSNSRPQTRTHKACLTAADLAKPLEIGEHNKGTCERTLLNSSAMSQQYKLECTSGPVKSTGMVRILAVNPDGMRGTSRVDSTDGTRSATLRIGFTGRWLGPSCSEADKK